MDVREKLVELLMRVEDNMCDDCGREPVGCAVIAIADHLIAHGVTVQEWISVKERLPEADKQVLVFTAHSNVKVARCNFYKNGTEVNWETNDGLGERAITHWMPLPQPPKGE